MCASSQFDSILIQNCIIPPVEYININFFQKISSSNLKILVAVSLVLIFFMIYHSYSNGKLFIVNVISRVVNWLSSVYPKQVYVHSTIVTAGAAVVAYLIFLPLTNELVVNITAVYATILFFNATLNNPVPLLDINFKNNPKSVASASDLVSDEVNGQAIKQLLRIENHGDTTAESIQLQYRVLERGAVLRKWDSITVDKPNLPPDDFFDQEILLDTLSESSEKQKSYTVEIRVKPSVREGHLTVWRFHTTTIEIGSADN